MAISRPSGEYKQRMTEPPAWPEVDEDSHSRRSMDLVEKKRQLDGALESWTTGGSALFDRRNWLGRAADSGERSVSRDKDMIRSLGDMVDNAVSFHNHAYTSITNTKHCIIAICDAAQKAIDAWNSPSLPKDALSQRAGAIEDLVKQAFVANCAVVDSGAKAVAAGQIFIPVPDASIPTFAGPPEPSALTPSSPTAPSNVVSVPRGTPQQTGRPAAENASSRQQGTPREARSPGAERTSSNATAAPTATVQNVADHGSRSSSTPPPSNNAAATAPMSPPSPTPSMGGGSGSPMGSTGSPSGGSPSPSSSGAGSKSPAAATSFEQPKSDTAPAKNTPQGAASGGGDNGPAPAEQSTRSATAAQGVTHPQPNLSPAAATAQPVTPVAQPSDPASSAPVSHTAGSTGGGGVGGGGGGMPGGGGGGSYGSPSSGAPMPPPMPLGPPATPPPAGPPPPGSAASQPAAANPTGPGVNPASTNRTDIAAAGVAPLPVSPARLERDAALNASTAGAMRRQRGKGNASAALEHARRIAAALNMSIPHYGFFWVTGLTADGSIVVANSYGLAYIPDGVELPPQVTMATADDSVPPTERAKWVTFPILAIQGWALAHGQRLRAVIATAEQFANFDPGVPKVVLQQDDIPDNGKMRGRSRLEVISPVTAARLAAVGDGALQDLLPPAPTDSAAPEERLAALWFELTKPLMSTNSDRGTVHLEAFVEYADHAQELALYKAYTAVDAEQQRNAIADWVYWQHLSVIMDDALNADATV